MSGMFQKDQCGWEQSEQDGEERWHQGAKFNLEPVGQSEDADFYTAWDGEPLKDFKQRNDRIWFMF